MKELVLDMLEKGLTLADMPEDLRAKVLDNDSMVHYIAEATSSQETDPEVAQEAIMGQLGALGFDVHGLEKRASVYNRLANGVADTAASVGAGAVNIYDYLFEDGKRDPNDLTSTMETALDKETKADSKLFKALYPTQGLLSSRNYDKSTKTSLGEPYDIATSVGQETPSALVGGLAGRAVKTGMAIEAGLEGARGSADSKDTGLAETIVNMATPIGSYGVAKTAANALDDTYKGIKKFEKAVDDAPDLEKRMEQMAKDKGIDIKKLSSGDEYNYNATGDLDDIDRANLGEFKTKEYDEAKKARNLKGDKEDTMQMGVDTGDKNEMLTKIGRISKTPSDFVDQIINLKVSLNKADDDYSILIDWAENVKAMTPSKKADALSKAGLDAIGIKFGYPFFRRAMPESWNKAVGDAIRDTGRTAAKVLTAPIGG